MMLWIKLGWRNLWRNKRRTIIELLSIGGSVFIGIAWNNLAVGSYDKMIDEGVRMGSGHIGVYHTHYLQDRKTEQVIDGETLPGKIEQVDGVSRVLGRLNVPGLVKSARENRAGGIMGIDFESEKGINPVLRDSRITEGGLPAPDNGRGALIGADLAGELGLDIGNKFVIMVQDSEGEIASTLLRVTGFLKTGVREIDSGAVYMHRARLAELIGRPGKVHEIAVLLDSHKDIPRVLPEIRKITANYTGTEAVRWEKAMPQVADAVHMDYAGFQVMVVILYVIVGIGTINTILMSVMERTREFGVIRAIGVSRSGIRKMVVSEAFVLALAGVTVGVILGVITGLYTHSHGIDLTSAMGGAQEFGGVIFEPVMYSSWDIRGMAGLCIGMIIVALLASIYPAHHIMKVRPSDAMRMY